MKILYKAKILINYLITKYELWRFKSCNLEKFQQRKIKKHLKYVKRKSKYYNKIIKSKNPELSDLPIVNKKIMMDNFEEFCTVKIKKDEAFAIAIDSERSRMFSKEYEKYTVALSSGTSGNRGLIVVNEFDRSLWTGRILAKFLPGSLVDKERIAFFLRANNNVYESLNSKTIKFKYFDLMNSVEENIRTVEKFNPTIITAPPSMLLIIAEYIQKDKIKIAPKMIISVAEVLHDSDKQKLEKVFNQTIHQIYQATEGFLGHTCKCGTLHINEDIVKIEKEYIDEKSGRFVPIITDFRRRTQPILRYRLNDILIEKKEKCQCGSKFMAIDKIEGREDDIFIFASEKGEKLVFPDFISRAVIFSDEEIIDYYVCQQEKNDMKIYLEVREKEKLEKIKMEIEKNLFELKNRFSISEMKISFIDKVILEKGKKKKRVERLF